MSKFGYVRGVVRAVLGNGNNKPGEAPFCQQVIQDNKDAHKRLERYIGDVDKRSTKADEKVEKHMRELRRDMNSGLDRIVSILKPDG